MIFICKYCKRTFGTSKLLTDEEMRRIEKRPVGKRNSWLGKVCFECLDNNPRVPEITETLLISSETIYV